MHRADEMQIFWMLHVVV